MSPAPMRWVAVVPYDWPEIVDGGTALNAGQIRAEGIEEPLGSLVLVVEERHIQAFRIELVEVDLAPEIPERHGGTMIVPGDRS